MHGTRIKLRFLSVQKIDGGVKFLKKQNTGKLRIIPLGGLEQIGMNITAFEYEDSIIVVDCGLCIPWKMICLVLIWLFRISHI